MSTVVSPLSIAGTRQSGASVRTQNGKEFKVLETSASKHHRANEKSTCEIFVEL